MRGQRGNFLLQALLALTLVVAFLPFFANRLFIRERDAQMRGFTTQVENIAAAARIYLRENLDNVNYNTTTVSGDALVDMLEPYGMPLGFVPRTNFNQDISLVTYKTDLGTLAYIALAGGDLPEITRAEQVRRLGFYASMADGRVYLIVPLEEPFSNLVRRDEKQPGDNGFLSDLDMGGFGISGAGSMLARTGDFGAAQIANLSLFGTPDGRRIKNYIAATIANKAVFQAPDGTAALSIARGEVAADTASVKTIAAFGDAGNLIADSASLFQFDMTAGRSGFTGPAKWDVRGDVVTDNISFDTQVLEIASNINASRGQDVFIGDSLEYSMQSGIDADIVSAAYITMRDQTSSSLLAGGAGEVILDIRPAGTSMLPDAVVNSVDNDGIEIISRPAEDDGKTVDCRNIINSLGGSYDAGSVSHNIICRYVFWSRLEKRIDIKQCMINGGGDCE